jgi:selenide, water dikinase
MIATIDVFAPIVNDAYDFGQIAAANSLSDIYAAGGVPLVALSFLAFPRIHLESGAAGAILRGGRAKMDEAGVSIIGGHSIEDAVPKFGFAVIGRSARRKRRRVRSGDLVILTKPLGTGIVGTAIKAGRCPEALVADATELMVRLNASAGRAASAADAAAVTDVTGYGLVGHLLNLGAQIEIAWNRVPVLPAVAQLIEAGIQSSGGVRNRRDLSASYRIDESNAMAEALAFDPQTNGGLLVVLSPTKESTFRTVAGLDHTSAPVIGRVIATDRALVLIRGAH